ncbi:MAG TPA: metalloregulator ArsR/SmtB family transcription factor [Gammaproteobacteria bacterium]|nr:metalloregulator ArsR/SmtB family transcription factor [Gammaproteobacteria bacterium]
MSDALDFSTVAGLIADPTRSAMVAVLFDGRALPAGELAYAAGVTPQTASAHLSKLLNGGILAVEREGRHRYYRLAGPEVAEALEQLSVIGGKIPARLKPLSPEARHLRFARRCYNHMAGQLAVAVTRGLLERGFIAPLPDKRFELTVTGAHSFEGIGLDTRSLRPTRRGVARQCLDWTERDHHLAGPLGAALLEVFCANDWLRRSKSSRALRLTPAGRLQLRRWLGLEI